MSLLFGAFNDEALHLDLLDDGPALLLLDPLAADVAETGLDVALSGELQLQLSEGVGALVVQQVNLFERDVAELELELFLFLLDLALGLRLRLVALEGVDDELVVGGLSRLLEQQGSHVGQAGLLYAYIIIKEGQELDLGGELAGGEHLALLLVFDVEAVDLDAVTPHVDVDAVDADVGVEALGEHVGGAMDELGLYRCRVEDDGCRHQQDDDEGCRYRRHRSEDFQNTGR